MVEKKDLFCIEDYDKVLVTAFSGRGEAGSVQNVKDYLHSAQLNPIIADDIYGDDMFYANTNEKRATALFNALENDQSKIIWAMRGGKGISETMEFFLEQGYTFDNVEKKFVVGFSDFTGLLLMLQKSLGWDTLIHAPMLEQIAKGNVVDQNSVIKLFDLLYGNLNKLEYNVTPILPHAESCAQRVPHDSTYDNLDGLLLGGNLTLVEDSIGTFWQIDSENKFVFLEDVNVYSYQVERSLAHLRQAHVFDDAKGVVFGDFRLNDNTDGSLNGKVLMEVLMRFADKVDIPVFKIDGHGHGPVNDPLVFNTAAHIHEDGCGSWQLSLDLPLI